MKRLERYTVKGPSRLRMGYTTGSCAAAATLAAARALLGGEAVPEVRITTPAGVELILDVEQCFTEGETVTAMVQKDAGDDPDVTDGIHVFATVSKLPEGYEIDGGEGVGRVTRPGLKCAVGEAAINPVPRKMIAEALERAAKDFGYQGGLRTVIHTPQGRELAKRTFNPRLGIEGGISILGSSGLVEPMSEAALIDTIKAEMDMRRAAGADTLLMTPGNWGRDFVLENYPEQDAVKCSNYIGQALDYAIFSGFKTIIFIGHAGKLVKLAAGVFHTHSAVADARMEVITAHAALCGIKPEQADLLMACVTVEAAHALLCEWGIQEQVWASITKKAAGHLEHRLAGQAQIAFLSFCGKDIVMRSDNWSEIAGQWK